MSLWKIIFRNLLFFRKQNTGIVLAAALCGVVLTGALTVGDSVRSTLRNLAEKRVGQGDIAILSPDGFFEEDLAVRMKQNLAAEVVIAPITLTRGTITNPDGSLRVTNVQVLGVDERFWKLAPDFSHTPLGNRSAKKEFPEWDSGSFFVNQRLGKRLNNKWNDRLILRMEEPSMFSRDAPLSGERDNKFVTINSSFGGIVPAEGFGNFGLQGNQREPLTLFVPLNSLQKKLFRSFDEISSNTKFANFLLLGALIDNKVNLKLAKKSMDQSWTLEDAGIEIKELRNSNVWSVRTRQVFLSDNLANQASRLSDKSVGVLTYLVNAIENKSGKDGTALVPYSMMSAVAPQSVDFLSKDWKDRDIALNQWAADDLNASLGDSISVSYYTVGERRKLIESSREFVLRKILPMPQAIPENQESDWTPRFPGLSDAESCGEWDTGIPIIHKVRDRDEHYWDEYRGTPKGFISLSAGKEMWGNRWGSLTGLRIDKRNISKEEIKKSLRKNLHAEDAGLVIRSLREDAQKAVESPVDFGQLFMGFSFFVILAALAITGMLFSFSMEQRSQQIGVFRAIGWKTIKLRLVYWGEGLLTAGIGSFVGVFLATIYGKKILGLLSGQWSGAVSGASFDYDASLSSMVTGGACSTLISLLAMVWSTRKLLKREPIELLVSGNSGSIGDSVVTETRWHKLAGISCLIFSLGLAMSVGLTSNQSSIAFFGAGGLFLMGGLFLFRSNLGKKEEAEKSFSHLTQLNSRNLGRRSGRSLVTVGSMAAGAFLVVSTGAFRKEPPASPDDLQSGTGGFAFWGESATPIYDDLNQDEAVNLFDLNRSLLKDTQVVPLRLREGDDASCLNLNKALRPKIFGIKPSDFEGRFEFAEGNWSSLYQNPEGNAIPALVDQNTLMWALKMGMHERLKYVDGEGKPFEIEVVGAFKGSMLQGALFIKEEDFLDKFKQQGGYLSFMLTGNKEKAQKLAVHLENRLSQHGIEFKNSLKRLAELQKVENTYLSIFQGLGGLGMLIGTCGLGLVVVRNLVERGQEFALFEAIGYRLNHIRKNVFLEHARLAFWGIALGSISAVLGITPALFGGVLGTPSISFLWFFMALGFLAFFWVGVGVCLTLRRSQLHLLKNE
jgi:ABC-type antimicrobial peptide transport system permease subunit